MGILALLALVATVCVLGSGWAASGVEAGSGRAFRWAAATLAGTVFLWIGSLGLDLLGVPWGPVWLIPAAAIGVAWGWLRRRRAGEPSGHGGWGWGELVAAGAFAVFVFATANLWNLSSDFIYHWGAKGQAFTLDRGIDVEYLARPWHVHHLRPDYPNLVPSLFAWTALLGGGFSVVPMALWSAVWLALLLFFARELIRRLELSRFAAQSALAIVALASSYFAIGYTLAGGADLPIAVALMAGAVPLVSRPGPEADRQIGVAAAFAAASKVEGVPLAALLVGLHLSRRIWNGERRPWRELPGATLRAALPTVLVVVPWLWLGGRHGLFGALAGSVFRPERLPVVLTEMSRSLLSVNWHLLSLSLLALPWLVARRRLRLAALACACQLAFYVYAYVTAAADPRAYIETSAARLYFHLVPTVLLLLAAHLDSIRKNPNPSAS